jgi:aminoglycoside phosphotransferase (APT) family kinase protein
MLSGRPPRRLGGELVVEVARFCLALPRGSGPPLVFEEEMRALIEQLPHFSAELSELLARTQPIVASLPSVTRHGDLWGGNLLAEGDRLTGVIDWDAWHPSAVPATDLLHLVASARALATGRSLAEILLERPWLARSFREAAATYWQALEIEPREGVLEAVGIAWWAGRTAHDLARHPHHAGREDWLSRNVEPLLEGASLARRATSR